MRRNLLLAVMASSGVIALPELALAQTAGELANADEATGLAEIVVTAQRREESLQRAAVPVTAVTGDELITAGVTDISNLSKLVPALVVQPTGGSGTSFYLRGVGTQAGNSFAENAVSFNFNGVFIGRPTAPVGTFYDLERVEVVKGPQGTLYGRNATGGAVNVLPKRPRLGQLEGEVNLEYGNYSAVKGSAALNIPLGDTVAVRLSGQAVDRDGYLSDGSSDERGEAARASLLFAPGVWSVLLVTDYFHQHGRGTGSVLVPSATYAAPPLDDRIGGADPISHAAVRAYASTLSAPPFCGGAGNIVNSGCVLLPRTDSYLDNDFYGASATVEGDLGFGSLTVIPAYRRSKVDFRSYLPGFLQEINDDTDQMSLEARLSSRDDQRLRYVLGGFYFDEEQTALNYFSQGTLSTTRFAPNLTTKSTAAFGQATFDVSDAFRIVAGARYTKETKDQSTAVVAGGLPGAVNPPLPAPFPGSLEFSKVTWKAGVEWDAGPQSLVYANVATGFKTGGFFAAAPPNNTFAPEELTAYTIGAKNRFMDNRLQANIEAFYWDYTDQQITFVGGVPTQNGTFAAGGITVNAGKSEIYGVELDLLFSPAASDLFKANIQYLQGEYQSLFTSIFSNTGAPVPTGCTVIASRLANPGVNNARFFDTDCSGKPTLNSPEWSANLGYEHTFGLGGELDLVFGARTTLESSRYLSIQYQPEQLQGSYMSSDAYLTLSGPEKRWSLTGFVNNIEDEAVLASASNRPIINVVYGSLRPPRTYGVRAGLRF